MYRTDFSHFGGVDSQMGVAFENNGKAAFCSATSHLKDKTPLTSP